MRRLIGIALILHGLAHAGAGIWATSSASVWLITLLWWIAMAGFVTAGSGLLGVPRLDRLWRPVSVVASLASLGLFALNWHPVLMIGAAIDGIILIDSVPTYHAIISRQLGVPLHPAHRHLRKLGTALAGMLALDLSAVVLARPWYTSWGATAAERAMVLPGDEPTPNAPNARYVVDHAITIRAPADAVWPWLAQTGQDRAGFYSYDWLERHIGVDGWGAFVLVPIDDSTTRFIVRTRGAHEPSLSAVSLAPFGLLLFEPAHFIMQRGMLLGVKECAERAWRASGPDD